MTFTGTGEALLAVVTFYANTVKVIFVSLDTIEFCDSGFSILDLIVALLLLDLIFWYIIRLISQRESENNDIAQDSGTTEDDK